MTRAEMEALATDALDAACKVIQDRLGVTTGDAAAIHFSGPEATTLFVHYIQYELEMKERHGSKERGA